MQDKINSFIYDENPQSVFQKILKDELTEKDNSIIELKLQVDRLTLHNKELIS